MLTSDKSIYIIVINWLQG